MPRQEKQNDGKYGCAVCVYCDGDRVDCGDFFDKTIKRQKGGEMMPVGICQKCGQVFFGWALVQDGLDHCDICGGEIKLEES